MRRILALAAVGFALVSSAGCPNKSSTPSEPGKPNESAGDDKTSPEHLKAKFVEMKRLAASSADADRKRVEELIEGLLLRDSLAWFKEHFDDTIAGRLSEKYESMRATSKDLIVLLKMAEQNGAQVDVEQFDKPIDLRATGLQNYALQIMKKPTPLLAVRFREPGGKEGKVLSSFVVDNGEFRFVGPLREIRERPQTGDLNADILDNLPLGSAEKLLQEKGQLPEGAVAYLRAKGMLK